MLEKFMETQLRSVYVECVRDEGSHEAGVLNQRYVDACVKVRGSVDGLMAERIIARVVKN